jgi:hypothetical protein
LWLDNDEGMHADISLIIAEEFVAAINPSSPVARAINDRVLTWHRAVATRIEDYVKDILFSNLTPFQAEMMGCALEFGSNFQTIASYLCGDVEEELENSHWEDLQPDGYVEWDNPIKVAGSYRAEAWVDIWEVNFKIRDDVNLDDPASIRGILAEFQKRADAHQGNHASTRVSQRPKAIAIDHATRMFRAEYSAMLHD